MVNKVKLRLQSIITSRRFDAKPENKEKKKIKRQNNKTAKKQPVQIPVDCVPPLQFSVYQCPPEPVEMGMEVAFAFEEGIYIGKVVSDVYETKKAAKVKISFYDTMEEERKVKKENTRSQSKDVMYIIHTRVQLKAIEDSCCYEISNYSEIKARYDAYAAEHFKTSAEDIE